LLNELTAPGPDGEVVSDPNCGWDDLQERLGQDLVVEGLILPIQLSVTLRALRYLPALTVEAYEKAGGLAGLEALWIEREVAAVAGAVELAPSAILGLLLQLVDRQARKTQPRSVTELVGQATPAMALPAQREQLKGALKMLEEREVIRATISESGSAEGAWRLDHDYLYRGVVEAERRADRWQSRLDEAYRDWSRAGRGALEWWRTLLRPWEQPVLAYQWLRGRLRYGEATWYARWSTLRFLPYFLFVLLLWIGAVLYTQKTEEDKVRLTKREADGLIEKLLVAGPPDVSNIIGEIGPYRRWADKRLRREFQLAKDGSRQKLNAALALPRPWDPAQVNYLYKRLLDARPEEVGVILNELSGHGQELTERLWGVVENPPKGREGQRLRAACALASYAPPEDARWDREQTKGPVVEKLVGVDLVYLKTWVDALQPVRGKLLEPLKTVFRDRTKELAAQRSVAASILADYAADQADVLADLVQDADENQFRVLLPRLEALEAHRNVAVAVMSKTLGMSLEWAAIVNSATWAWSSPHSTVIDTSLALWLAKSPISTKEWLAKRQANAAVTLLRLGQAGKVWPLLKHPANPRTQDEFSDPRARSYLIHRLSPLGADPQAVIKQLDVEKEVSIRRALLLILGEFRPDQLLPADRELLIPKMQKLYQDDPDPGLHGAAEWLLRTWHQEAWLKQVNAGWAEAKEERGKRLESFLRLLGKDEGKSPQWYVDGQGHTMVVIPGPVQFLMGSPPTEAGREGKPEEQQYTPIGRSFAIASKEVTVEQILTKEFIEFYNQTGRNWPFRAPTVEYPVNQVQWYDAAAYCNWLSWKEGLDKKEWCYEPKTKWGFAAGMKLAENYLERKGYRLPTEAEWEYACRAGAMTSRYYGETEELLGKYAWYAKNSNSLQVPGKLKPNDLGLFDMLGNAVEWCQNPPSLTNDGYVDDGALLAEREIKDKIARILRGGSFFVDAFFDGQGQLYVRSASRARNEPTYHEPWTGFRVARTFRKD
jgi:formylglycine-generating enzyme required for sulfatase activity